MNIYMTETKLTTVEPLEEHANLGKYSKKKIQDLIKEFPDLQHEEQVYAFLYHDGSIHKTINLSEFAKLHNLHITRLKDVHNNKSYSHKGLIKAPEDKTRLLEYYQQVMLKVKLAKGTWE